MKKITSCIFPLHPAILSALLLPLLAPPFVSAARPARIGGVDLPESLKIDVRECKLAGSGLRSKFFFKVYAAGLYLANPVADLEEAVTSEQPKAILMHFIYDGVSGEKLQEAWREGFDANTASPSPDLEERLERFIGLFTATARKDDLILLAYRPKSGTSVSFNGREVATIPGADFNHALLRVWFGPKPADAGLKEKIARDLQTYYP